ncbi:glycosyltransferase [Nonlabens sp. Asnod3-H03]|uniref:Putative CDP-glycerol:glycerophosphateglycerophosphotransferase n=1 Tax=Nonlabens ulvanivorans TaxID=906888 RepID=A0A081DEQ8_NONUL|nr:glycosyltransferase [Nonlabens ulvanivorans]GAK77404.1 putative CDP-glycerol:glycerophosphateglycerophosphotransferase [Nonlabens ulvanivorans]
MICSKDELLTVVVLTYNQEQFIQQTLDGILNQETDFSFRILVCDDGSQDDTHYILKKYQEKYPAIDLILRDKNIGILPNFIDAISKCDKEFIAFCDGDDYWIDRRKLATQIDYLKAHRTTDILGTQASILFPDNKWKEPPQLEQVKSYSYEDLIASNMLLASTVVMRNKHVNLPEWLMKSSYGDWPLYLLSVENGQDIRVLNKVTTVYRKSIGVTKKTATSDIKFLKADLYIYENLMKNHLKHDSDAVIINQIFERNYLLMGNYNKHDYFLNSFKLFISLFFNNLNQSGRIFKRYFKTIIKR